MGTTHQMYKASSPYYQSILNRYGRSLDVDAVEGILREHSITLDEFEEDLGGIHETTDAADLLEWLGY